jgi:hypothetical protein
MYPILITQRLVAPVAKEVHQTKEKVQTLPTVADIPAPKVIVNKDALEAIRKKLGGSVLGHKKEGSDDQQWVSDECLGKMLADRYCMFKTAGIVPKAVSNVLKSSGNAMHDYVKIMALPLAIGGGIKLVSDIMKRKADAQTERQADQVFSGLKRTNSYVQENPELAAQAFDTLRSFAPALAAKPLVAKTFVEHVITSDGRIPPDTANMLASTQQLVNRLNEATGGGFVEGLKSPMSLFKHTISSKKGEKE